MDNIGEKKSQVTSIRVKPKASSMGISSSVQVEWGALSRGFAVQKGECVYTKLYTIYSIQNSIYNTVYIFEACWRQAGARRARRKLN